MPTQLCIFNPQTLLVDLINGVSNGTNNPADAGKPVVLNINGVLDPSLTSGTPLPSILYSVAGTPLPTPSSALKGAIAVVSDASSPTYMGIYVGGGLFTCQVICSYDPLSSPPTFTWLTK